MKKLFEFLKDDYRVIPVRNNNYKIVTPFKYRKFIPIEIKVVMDSSCIVLDDMRSSLIYFQEQKYDWNIGVAPYLSPIMQGNYGNLYMETNEGNLAEDFWLFLQTLIQILNC